MRLIVVTFEELLANNRFLPNYTEKGLKKIKQLAQKAITLLRFIV